MQAAHKVQIQDKASDKDLDHFKELHDEGGLKLEVETDANFLSTTKNLMVALGSKALKGTLDMSEMSLPVAMLSEFTRLEIISFEYPHLCLFLHDAAGVSDPIERMKMVVSGYVKEALTPGCKRYKLYLDSEGSPSNPSLPRRKARRCRLAWKQNHPDS